MVVRFLLAAVFVAVLGGRAFADDLTPAKANDIKKLVLVSGGVKMVAQMMPAYVEMTSKLLKKAYPELPDRAHEVIKETAVQVFKEKITSSGGFLDLMVPIYAKYYSHDEIKQLIAFHQTPLGKKMAAINPKMATESMAVGQTWGLSIGREIGERAVAQLAKEGLLPK